MRPAEVASSRFGCGLWLWFVTADALLGVCIVVAAVVRVLVVCGFLVAADFVGVYVFLLARVRQGLGVVRDGGFLSSRLR